MSVNDAKTLVNRTYSLRYQVMEHERLRRLQVEHKESSKSLRERAQQLSKQTQQRRRALEEKKQAMARAEEERRRKALEERHNKQKEATERFRTALSRQLKPVKSPITFETLYLTPKKPQHHSPAVPAKEYHPPPVAVARDRIVLGREVEVVPVFRPMPPPPPSTSEKKTPPNLDDVLECIRGKLPEPSPSMESIVLSPEPPSGPTLPVTNDPIEQEVSIREETLSPADELSSDSSTISLRDSLDSTVVGERESADGQTNTEKDGESVYTNSGVTIVTQTTDCSSSTNQLDQTTTDTSITTRQKKGILKKTSGSDVSIAAAGSSGQNSAKRVRFTKEALLTRGDNHTHSITNIRGGGGRGDPSFTPKMRISLNNRGSPTNHQILSSTITKLGGGGASNSNRGHSGRNGITIHIPQAMYHQDTLHMRPPINRIPLVNNKDDDVETLWTQISTFVHQRDNEDVYERPPVRRRCHYNNQQQQVKLWKRQDHAPKATQVTTESMSSEERRLMESIELINCKLRSIPTRDTDTEHPILVRTRSPPNQPRKNKQGIIRNRTYHRL